MTVKRTTGDERVQVPSRTSAAPAGAGDGTVRPVEKGQRDWDVDLQAAARPAPTANPAAEAARRGLVQPASAMRPVLAGRRSVDVEAATAALETMGLEGEALTYCLQRVTEVGMVLGLDTDIVITQLQRLVTAMTREQSDVASDALSSAGLWARRCRADFADDTQTAGLAPTVGIPVGLMRHLEPSEAIDALLGLAEVGMHRSKTHPFMDVGDALLCLAEARGAGGIARALDDLAKAVQEAHATNRTVLAVAQGMAAQLRGSGSSGSQV